MHRLRPQPKRGDCGADSKPSGGRKCCLQKERPHEKMTGQGNEKELSWSQRGTTKTGKRKATRSQQERQHSPRKQATRSWTRENTRSWSRKTPGETTQDPELARWRTSREDSTLPTSKMDQ